MKLSTAWRPEQPFTFVVGYEDSASRLRAIELYKRLLTSLSDSFDVRLVLWKFEPLGLESMLARATQDAINADLILISLSGTHPLPSEAATWIAQWNGRMGRDSAIAVLLDPDHERTSEARRIVALLKAVAEQNGAAFFSQTAASPVESHHRGESVLAAAEILRTPFHPEEYMEHWGLNE